MLTCLPQGICSWTFIVPEAGDAKVSFFLIGEQGLIELDGASYAIGKSGLLSPTWTLSGGGHALARATVSGLIRGIYTIETPDGTRELKRAGFTDGAWSITQDGVFIGTIARVHPFTRRATINCRGTVPVLDQLFAFWLVALRWRRTVNSASPGAGS